MLVRNLMSKVKVTLIAMSLSAVATVGYGQFEEFLNADDCNFHPKTAVGCVYVDFTYEENYIKSLCDDCAVFKDLYDYAQYYQDAVSQCMNQYDEEQFFVRNNMIQFQLIQRGHEPHLLSPHEWLHIFCDWNHSYW